MNLIPTIFKEHAVIAAQSTRLGGVSKAPFDQLNLGFSSGDDMETVKQNRKLFFDKLGIDEKDIATSKLVHGNKVLVAKAAVREDGYDAVITNVAGIFAVVSVADCTPILIYDAKNKAVGAVHAGWRSTAAYIISETLKGMHDNYGTLGKDCLAFIGACICEKAFEVGEEVAVQFEDDVKIFDKDKGKYFVDLKAENRKQLIKAGVLEQNIEISQFCTVLNNDRFYSYRKEKGKTGRMLAVIGMPL